ncbi:hypothetical protein BJ742DRAFT_766988 [Cladochytrium replicatum]|nr:hypothetical protein BJ742DRAFT_766988 [Cladochytrium replicatum]
MAYRLILFVPPGRGLRAMGSPITEERRLYAALNICAFVSTEEMWEKCPGKSPAKVFAFLLNMMLVWALTPTVPEMSRKREHIQQHSSLPRPIYGTSRLRNSGHTRGVVPRGFGSVASGPAPLIVLHRVLGANSGSPMSVRTLVDVFNPG